MPRRRIAPDMAVGTWCTPDGWPLRRFKLAARSTSRGSLIFLGGRGDFFEKYLESIEHWAGGGWHVAGFDWRGQGGSGQTHSSGLCHLDDFSTHLDDLAAFLADWRSRTDGPHIAIGHSMGAHVLLRAAAEKRTSLDGLVLLSPMIGIRAGPCSGPALNRLAGVGRMPGLRDRPIWRGPTSPAPGRVTSCAERHADKLWWKAQYPELARGGPTWGWLAAAARSMSELDRLLRREPLRMPGLILCAARDPIIDLGAVRRIRPFVPGFEHGEIAGAGHELLRESDLPRLACLARIDRRLAGWSSARPGASCRAGETISTHDGRDKS
jgi:lysophospholipase